ncbi:hypothetical protein QYE76_035598 [Lolium multiflorum]|uniref:Uncharacterized protein n=1 Tax=Lolium multiflorum TaxID=4521 RepID=A0AAD8QZC9_LOLMU|nr:hypothetical protein QYE76_035598 [Lolium multiflorum]
MTEGEEDEAEDEGERTESDSDARDFIRLPRGAKRGATSSSQGAPGEGTPEDNEGEETTSPPEGKAPAKGADEPRSKRLRQTILEGATEVRRPLKDALEAGARVGPGVKAIPMVKSKRKVLTRPGPVGGAAATRAAKAKKAAELKKAAESKRAAGDPADLASSREEPAVVSKATGATASSAGPVVGGSPSASASGGEVTKAAVETAKTRGPDVIPPMVEEETACAESATAQSLDAVPPVVEKERGTAEGSGLSAKMRERRTKATRDHARPSDPEAPAEETPSTEAVVQGGGTHESCHPPLSTLSFTELHTALGEVHLAEVKRLTAQVEEAAKKNRQLVAIGSKFSPFSGSAKFHESFYRDADFRAKTAEEATKKAKTELADLNKVFEGKGKELEDVIADYKGRLEAAAEARDAARGATATLRAEIASFKLQHAKELAAEREASESTVLAVQAEKTSFEAFVREMSRQILVDFFVFEFHGSSSSSISKQGI